MKEIKRLNLTDAIDLSNPRSTELSKTITVYVMPKVSYIPKDKEEDADEIDESLHFFLTTYIKGEFIIIDAGLRKLGNPSFIRAGMRLRITSTAGKISFKWLKVEAPTTWHYAGKFTTYESTLDFIGHTTEVCHGATVLIYAPPGAGKTYAATALSNSIEKKGTTMHRVLFGERRDDTLGRNTIDCDASAPIKHQMDQLYFVITNALADAYAGQRVCLVIDSLTRIIEQLTYEYSNTHMVSGGISAPVIKMVSDLFRLGGQYDAGYLTIIGTALYSESVNTWKNITQILRAAANAEIRPDIKGGEVNKSRRPNTGDIVTLRIFGWTPTLRGKPFGI